MHMVVLLEWVEWIINIPREFTYYPAGFTGGVFYWWSELFYGFENVDVFDGLIQIISLTL